MTDEKELSELCERIIRLSSRDQTYLLELVLASNRRRCEGEVARTLAAEAELRELEKKQREAKGPISFPPEAKREAG
jgi:hypothetical protein